MSEVNLVNTESQGTLSSEAVVSISALIEAYLNASLKSRLLSMVGLAESYEVGKQQAHNIEESAKHQAASMRDSAIGGMVSGGLQIAGGAVAFGMEYQANNTPEMSSLKQYQSETEEALAKKPGIRMDSMSETEGVDPETQAIKERMKELSKADKFSERNFESDKGFIESADENELNALKENLDARLKDCRAEAEKIGHYGQRIEMASRGLSEIAKSGAEFAAASEKSIAGNFDAASSLDRSSLQMLEQMVSSSLQDANKYADLAAQMAQVLVDIGQADIYQG